MKEARVQSKKQHVQRRLEVSHHFLSISLVCAAFSFFRTLYHAQIEDEAEDWGQLPMKESYRKSYHAEFASRRGTILTLLSFRIYYE